MLTDKCIIIKVYRSGKECIRFFPVRTYGVPIYYKMHSAHTITFDNIYIDKTMIFVRMRFNTPKPNQTQKNYIFHIM